MSASKAPQQSSAAPSSADAADGAQSSSSTHGLVILENLPCLFSDATLKSIITHVQCKGKVLRSSILQHVSSHPPPESSASGSGSGSSASSAAPAPSDGNTPPSATKVSNDASLSSSSYFANVQFELQDDAASAVRLWDQLTVDGLLISAWMPSEAPHRTIPQGVVVTNPSPASTQPTNQVGSIHPHSNAASATTTTVTTSSSGFRYPFAAMNIGWLIEYVNMLRNPDKSFTMCRILECLMCNAIEHSDPFLEYAVVTFYTKFPSQQWGKAQSLMSDGVAFEMCRQVFEVIGLVCKYPGANTKSRKMLLALVERLIDDISNVQVVTKVVAVNKAIPDVIASVRSQLAQLRATPDSNEALLSLMSWLKFLFACLSSHHNQVPSFPQAVNTFVCTEECPCYARLRNKYTLFINDVEKAKIVDALIMTAVRESDDYVGNIAEELLERYSTSYYERAVRHVQNGNLTLLRMRFFEAIRATKKVHTHHKVSPGSVQRLLDTVEVALLRAKEEIQEHPSLKSVLPLVDDALVCTYELRDYTDITAAAIQQLFTLQFDLNQVFAALSAPMFQLCVHAMDASSRRTLLRCANPTCSGNFTELLKCSGCKMTYYCSVECQKNDWKTHRVLCKEMAARKSTPVVPTVEESAIQPTRTMKPKIFH